MPRFFTAFARRRRLAGLCCGLFVLLVRAVELPRLGVPEPQFHDEFANLLAADTFASGRLTNMPHPLWKHFESFHIIQLPTYMSMHPVGTALVMAAAQVTTNKPWLGIYLSMGILCYLLCWMLQGWFPPGWALLGGLLIAMRLGPFTYWMNSYYGGVVAGIGGALVLGTLPRLIRRPQPRVRHALLLGLGIAILANSRPYEGLITCIPVAAALALWWFARKTPRRAAMVRLVIPTSLIILIAAIATCYFFWKVTGNPFLMPYQVSRATYATVPDFVWQSPTPEPVYRHEVMRRFYQEWEPAFQNAMGQSTFAGWLNAAVHKLVVQWTFYLGLALSLPLIMLPWVVRDRRMRFWLWAAAIYTVGFCLERYTQPHYLAPMLVVWFVFVLQSMRRLQHWRWSGQPAGQYLNWVVLLLCAASFFSQVLYPPIPAPDSSGLQRAALQRRLEGQPGRHLVMVRYSADHNLLYDWVYNRADIDNAKVVWAREMNLVDDQELLSYFRDRSVWLVQPDLEGAPLTPYQPHP